MTTQEQGHQSRPKNRLREQRRRSRLSQDDVARLLGISVAAVSRHESGHHGLSRAFVIRYAKLFKVTAAELYVELVSDDEANNAASLDN